MSRIGNPDLKAVNLYLMKRDIATARREARRRGIGYQQVIRGWVSDGATRVEGKRG